MPRLEQTAGLKKMESNLTSYITLVATSGVLNAFLCLYAFSRRKEIISSRLLIALTALQTVYIFAFGFELASDSLEEIKRWIVVEYIGIAFAPVCGLLLALRYIDKPVSKAVSGSLFIIPAITIVMVATNDRHHFFYKSVYLRPGTATPMADVIVGQWYIVHDSYTFACLLAGFVLLAMQWKKTKRSYRTQLVTLMAGHLLPMCASFVYLMGITPDGMDPVPFVLCITSALYIWAMVSARMLVVAPIAKQSIFESMREGVIVLDRSERLIDYNGAIRSMIPGWNHTMIGRSLDDAWQELTGAKFPVERREEGMQEEMTWNKGDERYCYEVRSSAVRSRKGEPVGSLLMLIDVTEQRQLQDQLKRMAYYDGLTSIYNRTQFIVRGRQMLENASEAGQPLSFILFDIDSFKSVNDTYGHEAGDAAIVHTAPICGRIAEQFGRQTLFARYGGEEFVMALEADAATAAATAERLRAGLEAEPLTTDAGRLTVTASFGVAERTDSSGTIEAMLKNADDAMYEAKRNGRNQVKVRAG